MIVKNSFVFLLFLEGGVASYTVEVTNRFKRLDYTVEVEMTNRFTGLDLTDRVPEEYG